MATSLQTSIRGKAVAWWGGPPRLARSTTFARDHGTLGSSHLRQSIIGRVVIHGLGHNEFVFHKNGGGDATLAQKVDTNANQVLSVSFGEIGN